MKKWPHHLKVEARALRRSGHSCTEIAALIGVGRETVREWCRGIQAPPWGQCHRHADFIRDRWLDGWSGTDIGDAIGLSRNAVLGHVYRARGAGEDWARERGFTKSTVKRKPRKPRAAPVRKDDTPPSRVGARPYVALPKAPPRPPAPKRPPKRYRDMSATPLPSLNVPLLELGSGQCKAITDDTKWAVRCCGHPQTEKSVYCAGHHALHHAGFGPKLNFSR